MRKIVIVPQSHSKKLWGENSLLSFCFPLTPFNQWHGTRERKRERKREREREKFLYKVMACCWSLRRERDRWVTKPVVALKHCSNLRSFFLSFFYFFFLSFFLSCYLPFTFFPPLSLSPSALRVVLSQWCENELSFVDHWGMREISVYSSMATGQILLC